MSDKKAHNCIIGLSHSYYNDKFVCYEEVKEEFAYYFDNHQDYPYLDEADLVKDFILTFDRRSSRMTHFDYCPFCGEKINWQEIRKSAKKYAESKQKVFMDGVSDE